MHYIGADRAAKQYDISQPDFDDPIDQNMLDVLPDIPAHHSAGQSSLKAAD